MAEEKNKDILIGGRSRQEWSRDIQKRFRVMKNELGGKKGRNKEIIEENDLNEPMVKRRAEALLNSLPAVYERYRDKYGYMFRSLPELGDMWIDLQLQMCSYDGINRDCNLLQGAAVWMLDRITQREDWHLELFPLLPTDEEVLMTLDPPDLWDSQYESDLIDSMEYVLRNRNADIAPPEETIHGKRCLTDVVTAERKQHADVPSRRQFDSVIRLLPKEDIQLAKKHLEEDFWQWSDRFFQCVEPLQNEYIETEDTFYARNDEFGRLKKEFDSLVRSVNEKTRKQTQKKYSEGAGSPIIKLDPPVTAAGQKANGKISPKQSDILPFPGSSLSAFNTPAPDPAMQDISRMRLLENRMRQIANQLNMLVDKMQRQVTGITSLMEDLVYWDQLPEKQCIEDYGEEVQKRMTPIRILDPYESCAALLLLIDDDSDLPWLYSSGTGLATSIGESLPWGLYDYEEDPAGFGKPNNAGIQTAGLPDWYDRKYRDIADEGTMKSLAQILYDETGCIPPRNMFPDSESAERLRMLGIRGKDAALMITCMNILGNARHTSHALNLDPAVMDFFNTYLEDGPEGYKELDEIPEDPADPAEQLNELIKENKRLKAALYQAERSGLEARKDLEVEKSQGTLDRKELADLREILFRQDREIESEPDPSETAVEFPYPVQKNTLIFGGHDTWEKAIRPKLKGNVRFISKDMISFDEAVIRRADVIWIQSNAISHTQFNRVVDLARQNKKPVRYFLYASAVKCAVQVAENDRQT